MWNKSYSFFPHWGLIMQLSIALFCVWLFLSRYRVLHLYDRETTTISVLTERYDSILWIIFLSARTCYTLLNTKCFPDFHFKQNIMHCSFNYFVASYNDAASFGPGCSRNNLMWHCPHPSCPGYYRLSKVLSHGGQTEIRATCFAGIVLSTFIPA